MKTLLVIGTGSFIGGALRFLLTETIQAKYFTTFPSGTLIVNIIGCFFIGVVYGFLERGAITHEWRLFLATGLLGGFTTFSAFSNETLSMLRDGLYGSAAAYVLASVGLGLLATFGGTTVPRLF
jgi:CrcB protein